MDNRCKIRLRFNTLCYAMFFEVSLIILILSKIFEGRSTGVLPYKAWLPYDYTAPIAYWLSTAQQLMTICISANVDIAFDTVFSGMMLRVCSTIDVFKHRFRVVLLNLKKARVDKNKQLVESKLLKQLENKLFADCVEYHLAIHRSAYLIYFIGGEKN